MSGASATRYISPDPGEYRTNFAPTLRLAHDFPIGLESRLFHKPCIGDHALHYFHTGTGVYELSGQEYPITAGALFLVRPGQGYRFRLSPGVPIRMFNIHFDVENRPEFASLYPCPDDAGQAKMSLPSDWAEHWQLRTPRAYEELFFALLAAAGERGVSAGIRRNARLQELLAFLYDQTQAAVTGSAASRTRLHRALALLHAEPAHHWSLAELAQRAGLSRSLLCSLFREQTGLTVQQYLRRERLQQARFALLHTAQPLKAIATQCGFADVHHFTRIFKAACGMAPGHFRQHHSDLDS